MSTPFYFFRRLKINHADSEKGAVGNNRNILKGRILHIQFRTWATCTYSFKEETAPSECHITYMDCLYIPEIFMTKRQLVGLFLISLPLLFEKTHVSFPRCVSAHGWIHKQKRKCINYYWSRFKLSKVYKPVLANFLASTVQYSHPVNCCEYCRPSKDGDDTFDSRLSAYAPTVLPRAGLCTSVYCALY